jgi:hypothetical protein
MKLGVPAGSIDMSNVVNDVMMSNLQMQLEEHNDDAEKQMKELANNTEFYRGKMHEGNVKQNGNNVIRFQTSYCQIVKTKLETMAGKDLDTERRSLASKMGRSWNLIGETHLTIENERVQNLPPLQQTLEAYDYTNEAAIAFGNAKDIATEYYLHEIEGVANTHIGRILVAQNKFTDAIDHMEAGVAGIKLNITSESKPHLLIEALHALVNPYLFSGNLAGAKKALEEVEAYVAKDPTDASFTIRMNCFLYKYTMSQVRPCLP